MRLRKYCRFSAELIREIRGCREIVIPPFNEKLVDEIKKEQAEIIKETRKLRKILDGMEGEEKEENYPPFEILIRCYDRNKQCLLAYVHERLDRIKRTFWEDFLIPDDVLKRMSDEEKNFMIVYKKRVNNFGENLDLFENKNPTITERYVTVVVQKEMGSVQIPSGDTIELSRSNIINLKRKDAEQFILKGILKEI